MGPEMAPGARRGSPVGSANEAGAPGCVPASANASPPSPAVAPGIDGVDPGEVARRVGAGLWEWSGGRGVVDPRLSTLVPGFDAPFFQAGLAGYSDAAMRLIARRHGCPMCVTEALLDRTLLAGGRGFAKADLGELEDNVPGGEDDHPLVGQIMGSDPAEMAAAALKMIEQGARSDRDYRRLAYDGRLAPGSTEHLRLPGGEQLGRVAPADGPGAGPARAPASRTFASIDVNLACPVKKVSSKARGGHWLGEPEGAIAILRAVREACPGEVPCSVKLRRAYDDTPAMARNAERILDAAFDLGYAWATVHARTVAQKYVGPSRWDLLRDIASRRPDRPIFGSGDVWEAPDIFRMIGYAGVAGVSVARGCIGNPWIFRQAREMMAGRGASAPTIHEQRVVLDEHFRLLLAVHRGMRDAEHHAAKLIRKFGIRFSRHHPSGDAVRERMIRVESLAAWRAVLEEFYGSSGTSGSLGLSDRRIAMESSRSDGTCSETIGHSRGGSIKK